MSKHVGSVIIYKLIVIVLLLVILQNSKGYLRTFNVTRQENAHLILKRMFNLTSTKTMCIGAGHVDLVHYTLREGKQTDLLYPQLNNCILTNFDCHCVCLNVIPCWVIKDLLYIFNVLTAKERSLPQHTFPFVIAILPEDGRQKRPKHVAEEK